MELYILLRIKNHMSQKYDKKYLDLRQNKAITYHYISVYLIFPHGKSIFLPLFFRTSCTFFLCLLVRFFFITDFEQLNYDVPRCGYFHECVYVCVSFRITKLLRFVGLQSLFFQMYFLSLLLPSETPGPI